MLAGCAGNDKKETIIKKSCVAELELSIRHVFDTSVLNLDCVDNDIDVILRNNSDSVIRVPFPDHDPGYYNITFEIKTADSIYHISKAPNHWLHSDLCDYRVMPGESFVIKCNLRPYACDEDTSDRKPLKRKILRSGHDWNGLPIKPYDSAMIRCIYQSQPINESESAGQFLPRLESRFYPIRIERSDYISFREIIDLPKKPR